MQAIANRLNLESIPRRVSSKTQCWRISTIEYILSNERYVGDSLWQKTYQTRELPHRAKKNKGELEQYYLPDTHLPIIDRETFLKAKQLRLSRKQCPARIREGDILRKRLRCGICGGPFRSIYGRNTHSYECQAKNRGSKNVHRSALRRRSSSKPSSACTSSSSAMVKAFSRSSSQIFAPPEMKAFSGARASWS